MTVQGVSVAEETRWACAFPPYGLRVPTCWNGILKDDIVQPEPTPRPTIFVYGKPDTKLLSL